MKKKGVFIILIVLTVWTCLCSCEKSPSDEAAISSGVQETDAGNDQQNAGSDMEENQDTGEEQVTDPLPSQKKQPYEYAERWQWVAPIEEAGYCGPASLYHIISYFGDQGSYYYRIQSLFSSEWGEGLIDIPDITHENPLLVSETAFGLFIQPEDGYGSGWSLLDNVAHLYYTRDLKDRVYDVFVCSSYTEPEEIDTRRKRLDEIFERVLEKNIPVIVHLSSGYPGYGHYITLIGYDPVKAVVYYVDSLKHDTGILSAPVKTFLETHFYEAGMLYSARWDGTWMAFWHRGDDVESPSCFEPVRDE